MKLREEEIVSTLRAHHRLQTRLCDSLEQIADTLPEAADRQHCLTLARQIYPVLRQAHRFEEDSLFPHLLQMQTAIDGLPQSLERQQFEHWEDEAFAEELTDCLLEFGSDQTRSDTEKLAYMLRGFFEGLRRHIAFETEHLLPILTQRIQATHSTNGNPTTTNRSAS